MYNIKTGTLYYLAIHITVYSERFVWQPAKQGLLLHYVFCRCHHI